MDELCDKARSIRDRANCMEAGDFGWDLRQETIDLCDLFCDLAIRLKEVEDRFYGSQPGPRY